LFSLLDFEKSSKKTRFPTPESYEMAEANARGESFNLSCACIELTSVKPNGIKAAALQPAMQTGAR